MTEMPTLHIRQDPPVDGTYPIRLTLRRPGQADLEAEAKIEFSLTPQEQEDLRQYLEKYLQLPRVMTAEHVEQIEAMMHDRGVELYEKILEGSRDARRVFDRVLDELADLRIEIASGTAEAAAIPWELIREPQSDSPIAVRVRSFVRVQSSPNINFVSVPECDDGRVRLLYVVCRPSGTNDVELRAVVNRLLQDLGADLDRFDITALRPPTYERLQQVLRDAKHAGRPFHIVHFDGHGIYADLSKTSLREWAALLSSVMLGGESKGKHGYLLFEHPGSDEKMRPVPGSELGKLLHDCGVPVLVLNACQSAMHEATGSRSRETSNDEPTVPNSNESGYANVHDEVRAIGSLAQAVVDQGIPAVLGMRYSVYVVTAAQYIGQLYSALAKGRGFGQAATEGRKHLHANPDRWVGLQPRPLQDWFVPVVYEAGRLELFSGGTGFQPVSDPASAQNHGLEVRATSDPIQTNPALLRYVPDTGFIGRDETLLLLDRAFDTHRVVLLHAYAGQGKSTTAVEFARWYAMTGGLASPRVPQPVVLLTSFENDTDLADVLNQVGQMAIADWSAVNQLDEKRRRVLELLRQIPVLWIWDNVEPVAGFPEGTESAWTADEQRELADFLKQIKLDRQTQARVLLTSRRDEQRWLAGVPYRVPMPRMRTSDAARLAIEIGAERQLSRTQIADWQPLLDYCAGNPLTLRVIAGQAVRMGLRGQRQIANFVQAVRDGEQQIEDADAAQGRDRSLGASLDYGFHNAFSDQELPIVALLHLFQGTVDARVLAAMGAKENEYALPEVRSRIRENSEPSPSAPNSQEFGYLLDRCSETGLLTPLGGTWYTIHPALPWFLRQLFGRYYPSVAFRSAKEASSVDEAVGRSEVVGRSPDRPTEPTAGLRSSEPSGRPAVDQVSGSGDPPTTRSTPATAPESTGGTPVPQSTATDALRAWVEAVGELSNYYHHQFINGNRDVIQFLALEEANLLHARRVARRHGWWSPVTSAMQGLQVLYEYQGRTAQWSRLVAEIVPDYCTDDDGPVPGREDDYSLVMGYRVDLARQQDRDLARAADLQEKVVEWDRQQAAAALALPEDTALDADQRNSIRSLGVSVFTLGQILREQESGDCVPAYEESIVIYQRIGDTAAEAVAHYNLGHAYKNLPDIRDLDAAEAAYQHCHELEDPNDALARSADLKQIGMVHHERFNESRAAGEPDETILRHAQAAESHYVQSLALRPASDTIGRGPTHNQLGNLYKNIGQTEQAREHYEKAAQYFEQSGNRYHAGQVRYNMALMYLQSASREESTSRRETLFRRAQTYAAAALRDFEHYQGRAADKEAKAQNLIDRIQQQLDSPP